MSWPLSQDYNEAIQDARGNFRDADLQAGEAVTNALGIPMPRSGNFADVYEVRCPSGTRWAVKCFTREIHGLRERYAEISKYLRQVNLPFMVDFQYLEEGIRVRNQWYPIVKMQWVEGFVLNEFVRNNLDKKPILQALWQIWLRMARRLRKATLAHGDLQHGNVMFVPGSSAHSLAVKLIDYDGMCVPSLIGKNSGEVGHPAFQHPERLRSGAYNQEVDHFSLLCIATALHCLTIGGRSLWERYDTGDNLLFRQSDFQAPAESPLFRELLAMDDPLAQLLVKELYRACRAPLSDVPLLTALLPEEKSSTKVMTAAQRQAAAAGADWDFGDEEPDKPFLRKREASSGMPLWLWGALGGAAALLLSVAVGAGLFSSKTSEDKDKTLLVRNAPSTSSSNPTPTTQTATNTVDSSANAVSAEKGVQAENLAGGIFCLSPAGDKLAVSGSGEKDWRLVDPRTSQVLKDFTGHTGPVTAVAFSADGKRAVTSGEDGMLRLWDVQTGQMIGTRKAFRQPVLSLCLSADGTKAAHANGSADVEVAEFEANKNHGYHNNRKVTSVALSPDGKSLVCGYDQSENPEDEVLLVWPLVPGAKALHLRGPAKAVSCIAVSPDGRYIAAGQNGETNPFLIWEAATGRLVKQQSMANGPIHQLTFSPDNRLLLVLAAHRFLLLAVGPVAKGGVVGRAGGDTTQDFVTAAFTPGKEELTLVYRKADRVSRVQTMALPKVAPSDTPPSPAATGQPLVWGAPVDPDRDCMFRVADGKLTITVPPKAHGMEVWKGRTNAPRMGFDVEGDFTAQVRVGGDFETVAALTGGGPYSWVGAGLFLWVDDNTFFRLERAGWYGREPPLYANWEARQDGKPKKLDHNFPAVSGPATYLRLQRRGKQILAFHSGDGQQWTAVKPVDIELPAKVKIGVIAGSTTARPFAPTFEQFQIKRGQGEMIRVDWPTLPEAGPVVERPKPTPAKEEPDPWAHLDLPNDLVPDPKDPILRLSKGRLVATKEDFSGPLDITMVIRGPLDQDVSFIAPGGAMLTFRRSRSGKWTHLLSVRRPDDPSGESGTLVPNPTPLVWPPNKWCVVHWEIKPTGMKLSINKQLLFQDVFRYNLTAKNPVRIRVDNATVEVKSLIVKSMKK